MKNYTAVGIALRPDTLERIDALAASAGQSRTVYVRLLIERTLLYTERGNTPNIGRLLTLTEHQTLLLDALCRKLLPDQAERLARAALDAVKKHHGA